MAMYYYASKISAIACGTRCRQTVLQKSRGQRDRDKYVTADDDNGAGGCVGATAATMDEHGNVVVVADGAGNAGNAGMTIYTTAAESAFATATPGDGVRHRRRHSEQLDAYDLELGFQKLESSVLGSGGIMYINGRIVSGPLDSLIEVLVPKNRIDFDKEFIFSFLLSSRLFLRPHELLGKLLSSVPDSESLESLVALLAEWTQKFPYDYRDERMMGHVKHIVARCSNTNLEGVVSEILSALLKQLTDLERHEEDLRACQSTTEKPEHNKLDCPTSSQYAQILCRLEKKLAKQIGPEEFLQCSSNVLLDKQKKWDQPSTSGGPPGVQDPKKTCNLETYLDWSARLRLFVCNEILQCIGIRDRSKTVELWSGVAQYCLLVGNYNSATAILESLESPPIARLKITWSKLQMTCQQLDCMQRHAEGHGDLWHKQASILNESHQKTDTTAATTAAAAAAVCRAANTTAATTDCALDSLATGATINGTTVTAQMLATPTTLSTELACVVADAVEAAAGTCVVGLGQALETAVGDGVAMGVATANTLSATSSYIGELTAPATTTTLVAPEMTANATCNGKGNNSSNNSSNESTTSSNSSRAVGACRKIIKSTTATTTAVDVTVTTGATVTKPNDWVVIPVFADIVKLALAGREECLQRLPNGHINIMAFDRMAAIVGAFTKHMHAVKSPNEAPPGEYKTFCQHMQRSSKLSETELMMASFDCEEPNNAEKLMYDLN
ncbi:ras-GEF domain-containing family member 1B isoform X2 [Bactrocera neohumeralis]|uniref:ras-GEF domain-containing family member 1B isoform X2 n=1 Tax=Bactrocera neohumeralis TaxID=98809 RepID=UPI002166BFBA|nr:ras-GEF domain-containing family member 1B isoform X2 [Bactrocera neohumeralis]